MKFFSCVLLFLIAACLCNATKFGSTTSTKVNKIAVAESISQVWNNPEAMGSFFAEDIKISSPIGEFNGKSAAVVYYANFQNSLTPFYKNLKGCTEIDQKVVCEYQAWGRFTKDFDKFKAHGKVISVGGSFTYNYNEQGLVNEIQDFFNVQEYQQQITGSIYDREQALKTYIDFWNGKANAQTLKLYIADNFSATGPATGAETFDQVAATAAEFHTFAPGAKLESHCNPTSDDLNHWLCKYHHTVPIVGPNRWGVSPGKTLDFNGVSSYHFDAQGKIVLYADYFDIAALLKR